MKFKSLKVHTDEHFALGQDTESGKYCLAVPVSNGIMDYLEYYELTEGEITLLLEDFAELQQLVDKCRSRENDDRLMEKPGWNRGSG